MSDTAPTPPRPLPEIEAEYDRLVRELGELEYQRQVLVARANAAAVVILKLNEEAAEARKVEHS